MSSVAPSNSSTPREDATKPNSVVLFTSDDGPPKNTIFASPGPLRGNKGTTFEGGWDRSLILEQTTACLACSRRTRGEMMKHVSRSILVACAIVGSLLSGGSRAQAADAYGRRSGHPYLTYSDANIARLKERVRNEPAISDAWK